MIQQYKSFKFNNTLFLDLLNVTLSNDFYAACLRGPRSIKEEKIPGRDLPYFFEVDDEPIEFDINFALQYPLTMTGIKSIVKNLITFNSYRPLHFGNYENSTYTRKTPIFNVIFVGEPDFHFIGAGKNSSNVDTYLGYFTLQARADRPYGYEEIRISYQYQATINAESISGTSPGPFTADITGLIENHQFKVGDIITSSPLVGSLGSGIVTITNVNGTTISVSSTTMITGGTIRNIKNVSPAGPTGGTFTISTDLSISPGIYFKNGSSNIKLRLKNQMFNLNPINTNLTTITFNQDVGLYANEVITINPSLKTIRTNNSISIYPRWFKDEILIEDGNNVLSFEKFVDNSWVAISNGDISGYHIFMETPSFIKGD
jgi:hypothetical protein